MPVEAMLKSMSEEEFQQWGRYAGKHSLPLRRIEVYLAQIAHLVAVTMGGSKAKLSDFMLKAPEDRPNNVVSLEEMRQAFGFNPRKKKA